jgi:outer membrane lipoprotein-sorting protein
MALKMALFAMLLATALVLCSGCGINGFEVTQAQPAANSAMRISSVYSSNDVESHFEQMQKPNLVSNTQQYYTCVDARGDNQHLSTPGCGWMNSCC